MVVPLIPGRAQSGEPPKALICQDLAREPGKRRIVGGQLTWARRAPAGDAADRRTHSRSTARIGTSRRVLGDIAGSGARAGDDGADGFGGQLGGLLDEPGREVAEGRGELGVVDGP